MNKMNRNLKKRLLIGFAGASGSGKSTLSKGLAEHLGSSTTLLIQQDAYYHDLSHLSDDDRAQVNFDHPDAIDMGLIHKHLELLMQGEVIKQPCYDFTTHCRLQDMRYIEPKKIIILEGIHALFDINIRNIISVKVFVETSTDVCMERRLYRDIEERGRSRESVLRQFKETVLPMYERFIAPTKQFADIVISGEDDINTSIRTIKNRIDLLFQEDSDR